MKSLSPWTIYGRAGNSTKQFAAIPSRQPKTMKRRLSQGGNWAERGGPVGEMLGTSGDNTLMATAPSVEIQALYGSASPQYRKSPGVGTDCIWRSEERRVGKE